MTLGLGLVTGLVQGAQASSCPPLLLSGKAHLGLGALRPWASLVTCQPSDSHLGNEKSLPHQAVMSNKGGKCEFPRPGEDLFSFPWVSKCPALEREPTLTFLFVTHLELTRHSGPSQ